MDLLCSAKSRTETGSLGSIHKLIFETWEPDISADNCLLTYCKLCCFDLSPARSSVALSNINFYSVSTCFRYFINIQNIQQVLNTFLCLCTGESCGQRHHIFGFLVLLTGYLNTHTFTFTEDELIRFWWSNVKKSRLLWPQRGYCDISQIWYKCPLWLKEELITIWWPKVRGQGRTRHVL